MSTSITVTDNYRQDLASARAAGIKFSKQPTKASLYAAIDEFNSPATALADLSPEVVLAMAAIDREVSAQCGAMPDLELQSYAIELSINLEAATLVQDDTEDYELIPAMEFHNALAAALQATAVESLAFDSEGELAASEDETAASAKLHESVSNPAMVLVVVLLVTWMLIIRIAAGVAEILIRIYQYWKNSSKSSQSVDYFSAIGDEVWN
jgi:hypothetical protein